MIISASRRTDIPTYFSEWFARRVEEGFLYVRNPMNALQLSRIDLSPEVVDCKGRSQLEIQEKQEQK